MRIRWPSRSRANRPSSPSMARSSASGLLMCGITQDLEVGHGIGIRRGSEAATGKPGDVGHGPPKLREVGDGPKLGRVQIGGELSTKMEEDADDRVCCDSD